MIFGFIVAPGPAFNLALGAYAVDEPGTYIDTDHFRKGGEAYGKELAHVALKLKT